MRSPALIETDESVCIQLPARQRVAVAIPLAFLTAASFYGAIWWGYQWLASTSTLNGSLAELSMGVLVVVDAFAIRALLLELATTRLVFERTTIEVGRSVLGIRIARNWYSVYRVEQFLVTHDARHPDIVRLDLLLSKGGPVRIAANLPTEALIQLTHTSRRRNFAYFQAPAEDVAR